MALNCTALHTKKELDRILKNKNLGTAGKLVKDKIELAKLCGISVQGLKNIFEEMGRDLGFNEEPNHFSDLQLARLLQV